jgi:diamine N-acetyltransferase
MIDALMPTANARVSLRVITVDTVNQVIQLSDTLTEDQQKLVASNAVSIAQAHFLPNAWPRAIFANETPVGFLMLHDNPDLGEYFLWRLMIAGPHQRKGFGQRAIEHLVDYVKTRPEAIYLCASYVPLDKGLDAFYEKLGFVTTGNTGHGETAIRLTL